MEACRNYNIMHERLQDNVINKSSTFILLLYFELNSYNVSLNW